MATKTKRKPAPPPFLRKTDGPVLTEPIPVEKVPEPETPPPVFLPWLTLEMVLWAIILSLAVGLRLWHLDIYPLSNAEASQSLVALGLYRGETPEAGFYNPLLASLNALAFLLFTPTDSTARLAAVLLGSLLVALPLTMRRQLGPVASLLAAVLLAFSPTAIFLSRTLNSEIGVAAGSLMIVAGLFNWGETGRQRWLWLLAGGLALLLTAGPLAFSILVVFGLILVWQWPTFKALWLNGLEQAVPTPSSLPASPPEAELPAPEANGMEANPAADFVYHEEAVPEADATQAGEILDDRSGFSLRRVVVFFLVALALLSTAALFNLSGFSMLANFLPDWLSRFGLQPQPDAGFNAVFLLTIYDPLVVFAGLVGLAYAVLRRSLLELVLAAWFVGLVLLDVGMASRPNASVILPLVPLAFLAALALAELVTNLRLQGSWGNEGLLLATGLIIAAFSYISLTGWLVRTCNADDRLCEYAWVQPVAALLLFGIIIVFFWFISEAGSVLRGAALVGVMVGLAVMVNLTWRLNYGPLMDLGYQPLAGIPASTGLVDLTDTLARESARRVGDESLLDTTIAGLESPALRWRLRGYRHLDTTTSLTEKPATSAMLTPITTKELGLGQAYTGQDFDLDAVWSPVGLPPKELVKWLIFRRVTDRPQSNQAILWLRVEPR